MEFIRTIREKQQTSRQENIQKEAERAITITDFLDKLYIAYNDTPLIEIKENSTPKDIVKELSLIRNNYIKSRTAIASRGVALL